MADTFAYVSAKVDHDDVPAAIAEAKVKAVAVLGSEAIELYEHTWTSKEVCTTWRRKVPDPLPPPP